MAYRPRARKGSLIARTRTWPTINSKEPTLLGFMAFKAASLHILSIDNQEKSPTFGQMVSNNSTVVSCAPVIITGIRAYYNTIDGLKVFSEIYSEKLPKELSRKKELKCDFKTRLNKIETNIDKIHKFTALICILPKKAGISQIKPYLIEIGVGGGDLISQFEYLKNKLGVEISVHEIIKPGMSVDVAGITKGKGWQGPVKRFGIKKKQHKSRKTVREVGTVGAWNPRNIMYTVPRAGQMGFHQRTEYNKQILLTGNDQSQSVTPKGGFDHFGVIPGDYIILKGSLPGPSKRPLTIRYPVRTNNDKIKEPKIIHISTIDGDFS